MFITGDREIQPVLCLKCCVGNTLREKLKIPLVNEAREKALALAAQQQMSALEYERRKVTGTLESSSVRVAVAALGLSQVEVRTLLTADLIIVLCSLHFEADREATLLTAYCTIGKGFFCQADSEHQSCNAVFSIML